MLLLPLLLTGCKEQILHDLSEQDANKVLSRLSAGNLDAEKKLQSDGRWAIAVPRDQMIMALSYLDTNRVLAPRASGSGVAAKSGLVPSREEQWFRYERSVAVSIEESLSTMQGVLEARVHLNLPETDPLFGTRKEDVGSGSVLLVIDPRFGAQDQEIAALVAGAAGVPAAKVTVLRSVAQAPQVTIVKAAPAADNSISIAAEPAAPPAASEAQAQPVASAVEAQASAPVTTRDINTQNILVEHADVGIASVAVVVMIGAGAVAWRRRSKKVKFALPEGLEVEE